MALFLRSSDSAIILSGTEISGIWLSPAGVLWEPETPPHYHQLQNNGDRVCSSATATQSHDSLHSFLVFVLILIFITDKKYSAVLDLWTQPVQIKYETVSS